MKKLFVSDSCCLRHLESDLKLALPFVKLCNVANRPVGSSTENKVDRPRYEFYGTSNIKFIFTKNVAAESLSLA
ncbi:conserved hypothetical protein [Ricinus communis]|uniref:Uncharacterized protein n=1 Tax=Ricinus communis TaxID=3988 RepID=B9T765_RICCO|nr:conserved hypothetical protein [Ricinus communis]